MPPRWSDLFPQCRQFVGGDIVDVVSGTLARTRLDPTLLTLELTESTLIDDAFTVGPVLHALRDLGVNLALDEFGTGYSSLGYLRASPINIVKIGQSFRRTIGTRREDYAIVAASPVPIAGFRRIGDVTSGQGVALRGSNGEDPIEPRGFDHFTSGKPRAASRS